MTCEGVLFASPTGAVTVEVVKVIPQERVSERNVSVHPLPSVAADCYQL